MLLLLFTILSFIIITFSFGDFLLKISKLVKCEVDLSMYIFLDKMLLGVFTLTLLLSFINIYIPINYLIFIPLFVVSTIYVLWLFRKKELEIKLAKKEIFWIILALIFTLCSTVIVTDSWDSQYYHMQFVESMFRFPLINGIGNFEDRFGFNSSIFVLYPLFGFKELVGFHLFEINSILFLIILWYLIDLLCKNFTTTNVFQLILLTLIYILLRKSLNTSSNDITVTLLAYYITMRYLASSGKFCDLAFLFIFVPCLMTTSKLSSIFFLLLSFIIVIYLFKKKYSYTAIFSVFISISFFVLWFYRNVCISGYLIYPLSFIDLFDVPWKVPKIVALTQQDYIKSHAIEELTETVLKFFRLKYSLKIPFIILIIIHLSILATPYFLYKVYKKRDYTTLIVLIVFTIGLIFSIISAPDFRFYSIYCFPIILIGIYNISSEINWKKQNPYIVFGCITFIAITAFCSNRKDFKYKENKFNDHRNILVQPILAAYNNRTPDDIFINKIKIGNIDIYEVGEATKPDDNPNRYSFQNYELFPATSPTGFHTDVDPSQGIRIQPIESLEPLGLSLQDGFKTKESWKKKLDNEKNQLFEIYKTKLRIRYISQQEYIKEHK